MGALNTAELTFSELESERPERDRGFESPRFRNGNQWSPARNSPPGSFASRRPRRGSASPSHLPRGPAASAAALADRRAAVPLNRPFGPGPPASRLIRIVEFRR